MAMTWQEAQALGMGDQWMAQKYGSQSAQPEWQDLKAANPDLATWIDLNDQHYLNAGYLPPGSYQQPSNQQPSNYLQGSVYSTPVGEKIDYGNNGTWSPGMKTSFGGGADLNQTLGAPRNSTGHQFMPEADPQTRVDEYFRQNPLPPPTQSAPPPPTQSAPPPPVNTAPPPVNTAPPAPMPPPTQPGTGYGPWGSPPSWFQTPYGSFTPWQQPQSQPQQAPTNYQQPWGGRPQQASNSWQQPMGQTASAPIGGGKRDLYNPYG